MMSQADIKLNVERRRFQAGVSFQAQKVASLE
jgi:hypothetical protein